MEEILLKVYLQPRSSKNEIVGPYRDGIKVRVTAAPVEEGRMRPSSGSWPRSLELPPPPLKSLEAIGPAKR